MNRGPTVAQPLPVDRYAGNCLIKPSYYCRTGGGGVAHNNVPAGYHHVGPQAPPPPYHHYQQLQDWYGRTAYWHHNQVGGGVGGGGPLQAEKANFAAHKHGAPLIQAAKYNSCRGGSGPGKKYAKKTPAVEQSGGAGNGCGGAGKKMIAGDGGSDESSGAASENSLPRIIKPRKRRKKERKPVPAAAAAVVVVQPLAVVAAAIQDHDDLPLSSSSSTASSPPPSSHQHQQLESLATAATDDAAHARLPFDTVRLSAEIKAVSLEDVSTCQCACCDPVGNVWDVGRRCFSPSLTRPEPAARRSWTDEPSSAPPLSSRTAATVFEYSKPDVAPAARARTHSLEVSSEIVTSHYGHRDIEIKFFTMPIGDR